MKLNPLLISATLLASVSAMAQTPAATDPPAATTQTRGSGANHAPMDKLHAMWRQRHAQQLTALQRSLKLQPEQDAAWTAFTSSMTPHPHEDHRQRMAEMAQLTTPERIDKMTALKAEHDAEMHKHAQATKTFYASLSDEQKKIFDQHTAKFMRPMGSEHHGGPGHMMSRF